MPAPPPRYAPPRHPEYYIDQLRSSDRLSSYLGHDNDLVTDVTRELRLRRLPLTVLQEMVSTRTRAGTEWRCAKKIGSENPVATALKFHTKEKFSIEVKLRESS